MESQWLSREGHRDEALCVLIVLSDPTHQIRPLLPHLSHPGLWEAATVTYLYWWL